jgi:TIR domain
MKIFLSHAEEQKEVAEQIAIALRNAGHTVFLDKDDLPSGGDYNARLYRAIKRSDLFIYGISPESVAEGSYARTELLFAEKRFKKSVNHLLPVILAPTPFDRVPAYAGSVTILTPTGNVVAEVAQAVADIESGLAGERLSARQLTHLLLVVAVAGMLINVIYQWSYPRFEVTWTGALLSLTVVVLAALIYRYRRHLLVTGSVLSWGLSAAACLVLAGAGWLAVQYRPMVVWLLPGSTITGLIPPDAQASPFALDVLNDDKTRTVAHFGKSGVVLGTSQVVVDLALKRYADSADAVLKHYLDEKHVPQEHRATYLALWRMHSAFATGITLYRGTAIAVGVNKSGTPVTAPAVIPLQGEMPLRIAFVESH